MSVPEMTWPAVAELLRSASIEKFNEWLRTKVPEENHALNRSIRIAALHNPVVEYVIPQRLRDEFRKSSFPSSTKIGDLFFLPFRVMAFSSQGERRNWWVFAFNPDGSLVVLDDQCVVCLPPELTIQEFIAEQENEKDLGNAMEILGTMCYLRGDDHRTIPLPTRKGKKYRNRQSFQIIHGEVGGKFMSALRRYEAQQDAEAASRPHGSPRPHIRAGHFALYWTGKGSRTGTGPKIPKVQFVHPCLVNADSVGPDVEIQRTVKP